jgi:hypothetical protein
MPRPHDRGILDSLPPELLFAIAVHDLPSLCLLCACSADLRSRLLAQLVAQAGLRLRREEVTVGVVELIALLPISWLDLEGTAERILISDIEDGRALSPRETSTRVTQKIDP